MLSSSLRLALLFLSCRSDSVSAFSKPSIHTEKAPPSRLSQSNFYNDFDGFDDELDKDGDDDEYIDEDQLGDWRTFRMNLAETGTPSDKKSSNIDSPRKSVSKANEAVLRSQSKALAEEYMNGTWAHETAAPEVGGLLLRMPLEVELYRNSKHSLMGKRLQENIEEAERIALWYRKAQIMCENEMKKIVGMTVNGQIDGTKLEDESKEFLQLYLENQETWQEVNLIVNMDKTTGTATSLVLNRPMAFKLTENLAQLVLNGAAYSSSKSELSKFMKAFGQECAVYVGGPDEQDAPATLIHGFQDLEGAVEISSGTNIYKGGTEAAIQGVIDGKYKPLDFRFFVGKHCFPKSSLELKCVLGKYQPVASARTLALKQCISLPKPLYHEVLEMCGGELRRISQLELLKREDLQVQFELDDDDEEIVDELDELSVLDDDDDEDDDDEYII